MISSIKKMFFPIIIFIYFIQISQSKSCLDLINQGYFPSGIKVNCYQDHNNLFIGTMIGNFSNCYYECRAWNFNYNTQIAFVFWENYNVSNYNIDIYCPCHYNCLTCFYPWQFDFCITCKPGFVESKTPITWYLAVEHPQKRACFNSCLQRQNYFQFTDGDVPGQYLANIGDTKCVYCNSLCSGCQYYGNGNTCYTCIASAYLIHNYDQCLATFAEYTNYCQSNFQCLVTCPTILYFPLLEANTSQEKYYWSANHTDRNIRKTNVCYLCHKTCKKCYDVQNSSCYSCTSNSYFIANYVQCINLFPDYIAFCKPNNICYESKCPQQLYFQLSKTNTSDPKYPFTANSLNANLRDTNVCYLCHKYCLTCYDSTANNCLNCSATYFQWQQSVYGNRCNYFCNEGTYSINSTLGEFISNNSNICSVCAAGCKYCSNSANNCYLCQNNYFLIDDMTLCQAVFTCKLCQTPVNGGIVIDGCKTADKICLLGSCPQFFYFPLFTAQNGGYNDTLVTSQKYKYFTFASTLNTSGNGYEWNTTRSSFSQQISPTPSKLIYYRRLTNLCSICDSRCMKCTGPSNYNCSFCINLYYKWTNDSVCESFCPEGQFQLSISSTYPDNQTKCGNCDSLCLECVGYKNNCTKCQPFPNINYSFLLITQLSNSTCLNACPSSMTPLLTKGYYGSIATMICYSCPDNCSNCNIDVVKDNYNLLQPIACKYDNYCLKGVICTSCLSGFTPIAGVCINQTTCRQYSFYNSSTAWNQSNCVCFDGYYLSSYLTCSRCDLRCLTCNGSSSNNCLSCDEGFVLLSTSCVSFFIYRQDTWTIIDSNSTNSPYVLTNYNVSTKCGNYPILFGYITTYNTNSYFQYRSPNIQTLNYYAISYKVSVLIIDKWESTTQLNFWLNSQLVKPFSTFTYNSKGAIGQQLCGTNAFDYIFTLSGKINLQPTVITAYTISLRSNANPIQNLSGFYNMWGVREAIFIVLKCHTDCATCSGPSAFECLSCSNNQKIIKNGSCICDSANNYFWSIGSNSSCMLGCPLCTSILGTSSINCYYSDYNTNRCVNPPISNCSAPNLFGNSSELSNSFGNCVQNCSTGYFSVTYLSKCTSDCPQFNLLYYSGIPVNSTMGTCVSACPNNLIIDPSTHWCVSICPKNYYLQLQNRSSKPICSNNCTTGFEYDFNNTCVLDCPSGYFSQTLNGHHKCLEICQNAFAENLTKSCVNFCPNLSIADPTTHICVIMCPIGYFLQVSLSNGNRTCVTQCQTGQWLNRNTNTCINNPKNCPNETYADNNSHTCVSQCISGQFGENSTQTCQNTCLTGFGNWNLRICVGECPSQMFYYTNNSIKICVLSCNFSSTGLYGDISSNRSCVYLSEYDSFILRSSNTTVQVITEGNYTSTISKKLQSIYPDFLHNDAHWIWCGPDYIWPNNFSFTFSSAFQVNCRSQATLQISCGNSCVIYLNDVIIDSVGLFPTKTIVIDPICGTNYLKVIATTGAAGDLAGVIYSIRQNQTICVTNILDNNFSCDCQNKYPCSLPYTWMAFPICKCGCTNNSDFCFTPNGTIILTSTPNVINVKTFGNYTPTISPFYTNLYPNQLKNNAEWIWCGNTTLWSNGLTIAFQSIFNAMCFPAILQIIGNDNFTAYLNGIRIASGKYFPISYVSVNPIEGANNLTIEVTNINLNSQQMKESPAAFIFAIYQNQTIPNCVNTGYFNTKECFCKCKTNQKCFSPFIWIDYPTCKCSCSGSQADCPPNLIYNIKICRCVSKRVNRQIEEAQASRTQL